MKREFHVIIERDTKCCLIATVPELRGCHTQAKSLDVLMKRVKEAIELCLEVETMAPKNNCVVHMRYTRWTRQESGRKMILPNVRMIGNI